MTASRRLAFTIVALVTLTVVTWALSHAALGRAATPIALGIAAAKSALVVSVFMEVGRAGNAARAIAFVTAAFVAMLSAGAVADVLLR